MSRQLSMKLKYIFLTNYVYLYQYIRTLFEVLEANIDTFEMWCFCRMGRISWKDRITKIMKCQKNQLLKSVKRRQLRYYGHIKRQNNFLIHALEGIHEGKRPRGRPGKTWINNEMWRGKTKHKTALRWQWIVT